MERRPGLLALGFALSHRTSAPQPRARPPWRTHNLIWRAGRPVRRMARTGCSPQLLGQKSALQSLLHSPTHSTRKHAGALNAPWPRTLARAMPL